MGRVARARRERLGLKQELGPRLGKTTVGKIENGRMENGGKIPPRTQQHLEKALGWERGSVLELYRYVSTDMWDPATLDDDYDMERDAFAMEWIEAPPPDLTQHPPARSARHLTDEELLAELTYRMRVYAADIITEERGEGHGTPTSDPDVRASAQRGAQKAADKASGSRQDEPDSSATTG